MTSPSALANAIRILSADAVQEANSGHPGAPMGMADIAQALWCDHLKHNPQNPKWANRDRFVLSNGHGSMLLYSLLHLSGYDLPIEELKNFRQLHSRTPGHPELGYTPGVETTTGPLGQGIANAVGMAIGEANMGQTFNTPEHNIVDHFTYAFMGDGCMMEGISHEACALAGTLGLGKLIAFWDDNGISIDGEVEGWFTDDTATRFEAYGWHVVRNVDGHDHAAISQAISQAQQTIDKPSLICCKTIIGKGSPSKQGSESCHGAPLGADEIKLVRQTLGWDAPAFNIPNHIAEAWNAKTKGQRNEQDWNDTFSRYALSHPELAAEFKRRISGEHTQLWQETANQLIQICDAAKHTVASRKASLMALEAFGPLTPEMMGGSADLAGSNYTIWSGSTSICNKDLSGNYLHYGVREFGMAAISNGLSVYGGYRVYNGTFLVFSDYMRNGMRMSALMKQPIIYVLTHDSIGLGEDGPTHQPVEHTASLRLIPNMSVWRPGDAVETFVAWKKAIESTDRPTSLILSRQNLPHVERTAEQISNIERGGYILKDCESKPDLILIATGSEVDIALTAARQLQKLGGRLRVVSMPSCDLFEQQSQAYKDHVLPPSSDRRVAIEAGSMDGWYKYVGLNGELIGMNTFGESGPANELYEHFGITPEAVVTRVKDRGWL